MKTPWITGRRLTTVYVIFAALAVVYLWTLSHL